MKKYLLAAALVLASTCAMADREDSDSVDCRGAKGCRISSGTGGGSNMADACQAAKRNATESMGTGAHNREHAAKYSSCKDNCGQNKNGRWACNIDAKIVED